MDPSALKGNQLYVDFQAWAKSLSGSGRGVQCGANEGWSEVTDLLSHSQTPNDNPDTLKGLPDEEKSEKWAIPKLSDRQYFRCSVIKLTLQRNINYSFLDQPTI